MNLSVFYFIHFYFLNCNSPINAFTDAKVKQQKPFRKSSISKHFTLKSSRLFAKIIKCDIRSCARWPTKFLIDGQNNRMDSLVFIKYVKNTLIKKYRTVCFRKCYEVNLCKQFSHMHEIVHNIVFRTALQNVWNIFS